MPPKRKIDPKDDLALASHPDHDDLRLHAKAVIRAINEVLQEPKCPPMSKLALEPYLTRSRAIPMLVNPFLAVADTLNEGIAAMNDAPAGEEVDVPEFYDDICDIMPGGRFNQLLLGLYARDHAAAEAFISWIEKKASCERENTKQHASEGNAATTSKFKTSIPDLLHLNPNDPTTATSITSRRDKAFRGNNDNAFARALCPIEDRKTFDIDPHEYRRRVEEGEIEITEERWLSYMFPDSLVYNKRFPEKDFRKGHIFQRLLNVELVGPSGAFGDMPTGFALSIAARHGITAVTPRIAAYIAYHAYVALSSMPTRSSAEDGALDLVGLYNNVYDLLAIEDDTGISEGILRDMTKAVPYINRRPKGKKKAAKANQGDRPRRNPVEEAKKQRATRRAEARIVELQNRNGKANATASSSQTGPTTKRTITDDSEELEDVEEEGGDEDDDAELYGRKPSLPSKHLRRQDSASQATANRHT